MTDVVLDRLAGLIEAEQPALLSLWREQVRQLPSAQQLDVPTLNDHIPSLLDEMVSALRARSNQTIPEALIEGSPPAHGMQRLQDAFDLEEVVAEYNILRGCLHDLAEARGVSLQGQPFHIVNRVFDQAIGLAVQAYSTQRALEVQRRREEYLAFVAHDLRTPLNAIALAGRVLEGLIPGGNAEAGRMLHSLRRNVRQLEALVDKVLEENTNLETEVGVQLQRRELDLWPMVEALIHDLHPVAGTSSTQLVNQVPEDLVVYADAALLRRVLQNLIANAIRYTPRGVVVLGALERPEEDLVECWVSDDGAGIPEDVLEKVFEKGEKDAGSPDGTGLGLAIVKTFTEAHGGTVTVESQEGVGSTFRFTLPTREGAARRGSE
jgi:two-component system phosphate regulon sensor histidine kinase PhoR